MSETGARLCSRCGSGMPADAVASGASASWTLCSHCRGFDDAPRNTFGLLDAEVMAVEAGWRQARLLDRDFAGWLCQHAHATPDEAEHCPDRESILGPPTWSRHPTGERHFDGVLDLIDRGHLAVTRSGLFALGVPDAGRPVDFGRVEGMLLGLAIGDALGNTTEGQSPDERRETRGEIRDYLPNGHAGYRSVGLPSDDSQLAFWTLEHLLEHGRIVPDRLAEMFARRRIFGVGQTVRAFRRAFSDGGAWYEAAQRSAGNGALMRIAPVVLPYLGRPSRDLWADAVLAGAVTHNDPSSIAACVSFVGLLGDALSLKEPPRPEWWLDRYCERARSVEGEALLEPRRPGSKYRGPIWRFVDAEVREALRRSVATLEACESWYSGAFLLETVPCVLYILARHAGDPEEAVVRAVNDTRDNDTVAAIVGAAVGALHGRRALPERWQRNLLGRTGEDDDGRVFELTERVRSRFWRTVE